jgi:hypothetical protein
MYQSSAEIRREIQQIDVGFVWDEAPAPEQCLRSNPNLQKLSQIKATRDLTKIEDEQYKKEIVSEYCWIAYQKSYRSTGDIVVGRQSDLTRQGLYDKVANLVQEKVGLKWKLDSVTKKWIGTEQSPTNFTLPQVQKSNPNQLKNYKGGGTAKLTFLDKGTTGNVLNQDKWAAPVNDAWLLGGIHRKANFRLASPKIIENLWNTNGYLVVTAREIIGLINFGYVLHQVGPYKVFLYDTSEGIRGLSNRRKANEATLTKYSEHMKKHGSIKDAEGLVDSKDSNTQVNRFFQEAKNKLKHIEEIPLRPGMNLK